MNSDEKTKGKVLLRSSSNRVKHSLKTHVGPPVQSGVAKQSAPELKLHRVNGVVEAIEVQCSCGEKILIRCDYE